MGSPVRPILAPYGFLGRRPFTGGGGILARPLISVPKDGTSPVYRPTTAAQWRQMWGVVPSYRAPLQEASGNPADEVQGTGLVYTAAGSPAYQQAGSEGAYASLGVKTTDGTVGQGFSATLGLGRNLNTQSALDFIEFELGASGGTRVLLLCAGPTLLIAALSNGKLQIRLSGAGTVGSYDYRDGKRHPLFFTSLLGAGVGSHGGVGLYRVSTDKETFTSTWGPTNNDNTKGPGAVGGTACTATYFDYLSFAGSIAETLSSVVTEKVMLQQKGWTLAY